jgi:hypothetical protein
MIVKTLTLAAAALVVATAAQAHSHKVKRLEIVHPWCIETNDTANPVSVFMTIKNSGRPDKLLRATTSIAGKAELRGAGDEKAISSVGLAQRDRSQTRRSAHPALGCQEAALSLRQLPDDPGVRARRQGGGRSDGRRGVRARTSEEMSRNVRARRADRFSDLSSLSMT